MAAKNVDFLTGTTDLKSFETGAQDWAVSCGVCHVGGGQMEYDRNRNSYSPSSPAGDANYYSFMNGKIVSGPLNDTNKAEIDCLLCHLNDESGMSGNGRAWLQSMGCSGSNPMGPMNDPTCQVTGMDPKFGQPGAGMFTPGTKYDMYNRNLALKSLSFNYAASLGIGAKVTGWNPDGSIASISGMPASISGGYIQATPNSQNCAVCHARDDSTPGLPSMINMKYGYGNYAMLSPAGTAKDVDTGGSGTNGVLWFELGCKTGMGKRTQRTGAGPNDKWGMSMFNVMFGLNRNPGTPITTETIASTTFPGMNVSTKERMPDQDVHDAAGMQCATCHYALGSTFIQNGSYTAPSIETHGVSYPTETIFGVDHMFAQGDDLKDTYGMNNLDGTVSCESCHITRTHPRIGTIVNGQAFNPPVPTHSGFPALHLAKIACTTCHIPEVYAAPGRLKYRDWSLGLYKKGSETNGGFRNMLDWNYDLVTGSHKNSPVLHVWATKYEEKKITPVLPSEMPIWVASDNPSFMEKGSSDGVTPDDPTAVKTCNFGERIFMKCSTNADCPDGSCVQGITSFAAPAKTRNVMDAAKWVEANTGVLRRGQNGNEINGGNMVPLFDGFSLPDAWAVDTMDRIEAMANADSGNKSAGLLLKVFHANFDVTHGIVPKEWALGGSKRGGCASCHSSADPYLRNAQGGPTGPNPNYTPYSVGFFESYQQPLNNAGFGIGQFDMVKNWFSIFADYDCTMMCGGGTQPDSTYFDAAGNPITGAACGDPFGMGWKNLGNCVDFMSSTFDAAMGFPSGTAKIMGMYDGIAGLQGFVVRETKDGKTHGCQPFAGPANSPVAQAFGVDVNNCMPAPFSGTCTGPQTNPMWPASCASGFRNLQGCATDADCAGTLDSTEAAHNPNGLIYSRDEVRKHFKIMMQQSTQLVPPGGDIGVGVFPSGVNRVWWPILAEQNPGNANHVYAWDMAGSKNVCGALQNEPCCTEMDGMTPASCAPGKLIKTTVHANQFLGYTVADMASLMNPGTAGVQKPTPYFNWTADSATGNMVDFDATLSTCSNAPCFYSWAFGDDKTGSGVTTTHAYAASGSYSVILTMTDSLGFTSSATKTVTASVVNQAPTAAGLSSATASNYTVSFTDASSDPALNSPNGITSDTVNWGDGSLTQCSVGGACSHMYATASTYTILHTVMDAAGLSSSEQLTMSVPQKFSIGGTVTHGSPAAGLSGVTMILKYNGSTKATTTTATDGTFSFGNLLPGSYVVQPYKSGETFSPATQTVTIGPNATGVNFTATP